MMEEKGDERKRNIGGRKGTWRQGGKKEDGEKRKEGEEGRGEE